MRPAHHVSIQLSNNDGDRSGIYPLLLFATCKGLFDLFHRKKTVNIFEFQLKNSKFWSPGRCSVVFRCVTASLFEFHLEPAGLG